MKGYGLQKLDTEGKLWRIQIYTGKNGAGNRSRYTRVFHGSSAAANKEARRLAELNDRNLLVPSKLKVCDIFELWLAGEVRPQGVDSTTESYEMIVRLHLNPAFGQMKPKDLTWLTIQNFYNESVGSKPKHSATTVLYWHHVASAAFRFALKRELITTDPFLLATPPKKKPPVMNPLLPQELDTLLAANVADYYYPIVYTAVSSGLRQSELLALRWRDIDNTNSKISVNRSQNTRHIKTKGVIYKEPKSHKGRRQVEMNDKLNDFLIAYHRTREEFYQALRIVLTPDSLVFTTIDFGVLNPATLDRAFKKMLIKAGVKDIRFHDLRHTYATLALMQGSDPKKVSEALGHSSVAFTLDTYSHIIDGMMQDMARRMNDVLPAGTAPDYLAKFNTNLTQNPQTTRHNKTDNREISLNAEVAQ